MDKKKIIVAVILFVFLGLTVFTFANPDDSVEKLNNNSDQTETPGSEVVESGIATTDVEEDEEDTTTRNTLTVVQSTGTNTNNETNTTTTEETVTQETTTTENSNNQTTVDYSELQALVAELEKRYNAAIDAESVTLLEDARDYNKENAIKEAVNNVQDASIKADLEAKLNAIYPVLNDTKAPKVLINGKEIKENAIYNGNVVITVEDDTKTTTKSIKLNGKNIDNVDTLVDGNYEITIIDAAYNETTIKFTYDATAPSVDYLAILNRTNYDDYYMVANKGNLIRVIAYFDEELSVAPKMKIEGGSEVIMNGGSKSGELYVYSYDYRITDADTIAEGDLKVKVYGFADKVGNTVLEENAITEIKHYKYNVVNYDTTKPELNYNNGNSFVSKEIIVDDVNPDYITIWNGKTGKTETIYNNKYLLSVDYETDNARFDVTAYDKAGNVSDTKIIWIDNKAPLITGTGVIGNKDVDFKKDASYQNVTLNINDMNLKEIGLIDENGIKNSIQKFSWNPTGHSYELTFNDDKNYTLYAIDRAGNESQATFVIDNENPNAEVKYSNVNANGSFYSVKEATITIIPSEKIEDIEGWNKIEDENGLRYEKTFTESSKGKLVIIDLAGNTSKVSYDLKRVDSNPPKLTIKPNANTIKHEVNTPFVEPGYTAYDKVDKDVTHLVQVSYKYNDKGNWISGLDTFDTSKLGEWQIVYTAYDKNGNSVVERRPVKVVDTTHPAISFAEGTSVINIELGNDTYTELGATVTDNYDDTYTMDKPTYINMYTIDGVFIGRVNEVNPNVEGRYNLVYVATDSSKNEIKATRMVYVKPATESEKSIVMLADKQTFMFDNLNDTVSYINSSNYENVTVSIKGSHDWNVGLNYRIGGANTKTVKFLGIGNNVTITNTGLGYGYAGVKTSEDTVVIFENIVWDDETFYSEGGSWEHYYSEFEGNFKFVECTFNHPPITVGEYNYTFKDCKFNSYYYKLSENTYGSSTEYGVWINGGNVTFDGCTFTGLRGMKMHNNNGTSIKNIIIKNNTFDDLDKNSKEHAILIDNVSSSTTVKISNNKFINIGTYSTTGFTDVEYTSDNQEITK